MTHKPSDKANELLEAKSCQQFDNDVQESQLRQFTVSSIVGHLDELLYVGNNVFEQERRSISTQKRFSGAGANQKISL